MERDGTCGPNLRTRGREGEDLNVEIYHPTLQDLMYHHNRVVALTRQLEM